MITNVLNPTNKRIWAKTQNERYKKLLEDALEYNEPEEPDETSYVEIDVDEEDLPEWFYESHDWEELGRNF